MDTSEARAATESEESRVIDTILLSFVADPIARWSWPDPHQYLESMPDFSRAFGGRGFLHGAAHRTEDYGGAALWLPPNVHFDEDALGASIESTVSADVRGDLHAVFEKTATYHPDEPHWYLPLIGVDPAFRGKGYGGALMAFAMQQCDRDHVPAYLESSNPRNVSLYQRHGFEALGTIQVGSSPPIVPMLRSSR